MPYLTCNDIQIYYELIGEWPCKTHSYPICITPGGQSGLESSRELANCLKTDHNCILLWDRRNSLGRSGVEFMDEMSINSPEMDIQCSDLRCLLAALEMPRIVLMGNGAGARLSLLYAALNPKRVRGLCLLNMDGGYLANRMCGAMYYECYVRGINNRGMHGVVESPFYAQMIVKNPAIQEKFDATPEVTLRSGIARATNAAIRPGLAEALLSALCRLHQRPELRRVPSCGRSPGAHCVGQGPDAHRPQLRRGRL